MGVNSAQRSSALGCARRGRFSISFMVPSHVVLVVMTKRSQIVPWAQGPCRRQETSAEVSAEVSRGAGIRAPGPVQRRTGPDSSRRKEIQFTKIGDQLGSPR